MSNILTIKTVNITPLRVLITTLNDILFKTNITFTNEGINIRNVDTSHTVLINMVLEAKEFEVYECTKPKIVIGVNLFNLRNLISLIDKNNYDTITIYIEDEDYSKGMVSYLGFKFENSITQLSKIQKFCLIEPDEEKLEQEIENVMENKEEIS